MCYSCFEKSIIALGKYRTKKSRKRFYVLKYIVKLSFFYELPLIFTQ